MDLLGTHIPEGHAEGLKGCQGLKIILCSDVCTLEGVGKAVAFAS